jgi:DNA modification methylase
MPKIGQVTAELTPFWQTTDGSVQLFLGDVLAVLRRMRSGSVQCVVTSPPYWGLRSYLDNGHASKHQELGSEDRPDCLGWAKGINCAEDDWASACHVCRMVLVFREVRRVLRDDGTMWLNYGDSWGGGGQVQGVPWRVALALQADGWVLRQEIIWHKPSPMPESVKNRCTKAHEQVFLLTKGQRYFCDMEAIKEESLQPNGKPKTAGKQHKQEALGVDTSSGTLGTNQGPMDRNKRSVWTVSSQGYPGAHFATFPPKLIEPMILVGTSAKGACASCGAPWRRIVEEVKLTRERPNDFVKRTGEEGTGNSCGNTVAGVEVKTKGWEPTCECNGKLVKRKVTLHKSKREGEVPTGWAVGAGDHSAAGHQTELGRRSVDLTSMDGEHQVMVTEYVSSLPLEEHPVVPCLVLDPFVGSGTTAAVCVKLGRRAWGIDLSKTYLTCNAVPRVSEALGEMLLSHLLPKRKSTAPPAEVV